MCELAELNLELILCNTAHVHTTASDNGRQESNPEQILRFQRSGGGVMYIYIYISPVKFVAKKSVITGFALISPRSLSDAL